MTLPRCLEIKDIQGKGRGLFVRMLITRGQAIFQFEGILGDDRHTNAESLQIDEDLFLESDDFDNYLNHSCDPNCYIKWDTLECVAKKDIHIGEELTYDYFTSDWDDTLLRRDQICCFSCQCGSANCQGEIKGFKHLPMQAQLQRLRYASPFLHRKFSDNKRIG